MDLRTAFQNIHGDPLWWRKVLVGGAFLLTIIGAPWPAGLVVESIDNIRKGYPTPLPPSTDWVTRYIIGFFALIIDFVFFVLPLMLIGLVFVCAALGLSLGSINQQADASPLVIGVLALALIYLALIFFSSASPVGRLIFAQEGHVEDSIGRRTLRAALDPQLRAAFIGARLRSLAGYVPALALAVAAWASTGLTFPGSWILTVALLWLVASALVYAHLLVAQLYAGAARHADRL